MATAVTTAAIAVKQNGQNRESLYRGASEGTGLAAADLARLALADEAEQMQSCECCGLAEECTRSYVARVRAVFCGRYVCGLCSEAVKEELGRLKSATMEEALVVHMKVCAQFNLAARADPLVQLANVAELMRQILRKSSEGGSSPNSLRRPMSVPSQRWRSASLPPLGIARANSCFTLKSATDFSLKPPNDLP